MSSFDIFMITMGVITFGVTWYFLGKADLFQFDEWGEFFDWVMLGLGRILMSLAAAVLWPIAIVGGLCIGGLWLVYNNRQLKKGRGREVVFPWSDKYKWRKENA